MIDLGINSKAYKTLDKIYNMLKLNLYISIFSLTILGIGSSIATGFYCYNKYYRNEQDISFRIFKKNFKKNFKKGLFFTAIQIFLVFLLLITGREFLFITLLKIITVTIVFILLSYSLVLLFLLGIVDMKIKDYLIYGALIFIKKVTYLIIGSLLFILIFRYIYRPNLLIFLLTEWIIIIAVFHKILVKDIYMDFNK